MTSESPLFVSRIECPVCKTANEFEGIKVGSYTEAGRDTDFAPSTRSWRNPAFQKIHPLVYSMATCASCFYTRELDGSYRNWQRDTTFRQYRQKQLREAHLRKMAEPDGLIRRLGMHLDTGRYPHETAVNKLLLGILDAQIVPDADPLCVARYFLRIAWLYRDQGDRDRGTAVHGLSAHRIRRTLDLHAQQFQRWILEARKFAADLEAVTGTRSDAGQGLRELEDSAAALLNDWQARLSTLAAEPPNTERRQETYFEHASHLEFLAELRTDWAAVPLREGEALQAALDHYLAYFQNARSFESPEIEVQTTYLIGELARRTSQTQLANDYFNHAIRTGQQLVHELKHDPARVTYVQKLLEMAFEQGKKNREAEPVGA
jgi:hypothetical protein